MIDLKAMAAASLKLDAEWYIGAFTAAGTAAAIVPAGERLVAALLAGGVVIALGAYKSTPCCASCAGASAGKVPTTPMRSDVLTSPAPRMTNDVTAFSITARVPALPISASTPRGACS